jgi:hypothetical protein
LLCLSCGLFAPRIELNPVPGQPSQIGGSRIERGQSAGAIQIQPLIRLACDSWQRRDQQHTSGSRRQARQHQLADYRGCFVAIILESRRTPWSFLQANPLWIAHFVAPGVAQNKHPNSFRLRKKELPQLFDFICSHRTGYPVERYQKATMSIRPCRGHAFAELGDNQ